MLSKIIFPNFLIRHIIRNEDKKVRFYNLANIYITVLIWHLIVLGVTYISLDQCTNMFHIQYKNNLYCQCFNICLYIFISILSICILSNIIISLWYYHFNKYKNTIADINNIEVNDRVFILATLYKETKEEINQLVESVKEDDYKNLIIVFVLDGEFCIDALFNGVFRINNFNISESNNLIYNNNLLRYQYHNHEGLKFLIIVKQTNAGKKDSQCIFYNLINLNLNIDSSHELFPMTKYLNSIDEIIKFKYILLLDGDTIVENNNSIKKMVHIMNSYEDHIAICGTTKVLNKNKNLITMAQNFEYFISHLLLKNYETVLFNTLVLSGCFSMLRIYISEDSTLINQDILDEYNKEPKNLIEDNLLKFGEDRYLTNILINNHPTKKIKYVPEINCITEVPETVKHLILQRRRWSNSLIACHIYLLYSKFISIKLYFVIFIELAVIIMLPILIIVGLTSFIMAITIQGFSIFPIIVTINIFLINFYIILLSGNFTMCLYYIQYMITSILFTVIIPYDSLLRFNVVEWNSGSDLGSSDGISIHSEDNYILEVN